MNILLKIKKLVTRREVNFMDGNTGDRNTGNLNTGNRNTGDRNTGYLNTGYLNTGNLNTGNRNTGDWNTGNRNTGNRNTGDWNTGSWNTGSWNTGDRNTGYLNTDSPTIRMFNKDTGITIDEFREKVRIPDFFYFEQVKWISELEMTEKERKENPEYKTTGGYLKVLKYKDAWKESWDKTTQEDRDLVKKLPNFDVDIFFEISGIRVDESMEEVIEIEGKKWSKSTIKEALKQYAND